MRFTTFTSFYLTSVRWQHGSPAQWKLSMITLLNMPWGSKVLEILIGKSVNYKRIRKVRAQRITGSDICECNNYRWSLYKSFVLWAERQSLNVPACRNTTFWKQATPSHGKETYRPKRAWLLWTRFLDEVTNNPSPCLNVNENCISKLSHHYLSSYTSQLISYLKTSEPKM